MTMHTVDAEILGVRHSARLLPAFERGRLGIDQIRGRIVVGRVLDLYDTRHPRDVLGWRLACPCEQPRKDKPPVKPWMADQFWSRVEDPSEHDPSEYRVFAPDELTVDVIEIPDVGAAAHSVWVQSHIKDWMALSRFCDTITDLKAAQREYHDAVEVAKGTGLADQIVLATMGLRPSEIEFLNGLLGGGADG
jgi:hypothetical protein